jgi:rhamnulokinase
LARRGDELTYAELTALAEVAESRRTMVEPAHESFQSPGDMLAKISTYARSTHQPVPETPGQFVRACLDGLARTYHEKLAALESVLGRQFDVIHIVGGGGKSSLLCQLTANTTGRRVVVGPYEATAMGNALVQAMATGEISDLRELRRIVENSAEVITYEPQPT